MIVQLLIAAVFILMVDATGITCSKNDVNITGLLVEMLDGYDQRLVPNPPVNVTMEMHVQDFSSISELSSDFEIDVMYSEIWNDPKLVFPTEAARCIRNVTLKSSVRDRIWTPETCFVNTKLESRHHSPADNAFVIMYLNGDIWANVRMRIKAPCLFNLTKFPFDNQKCTLVIESYSFNVQEVQLFWHKHPVTLPEDCHLPDFDVDGYSVTRSTIPYPNGYWDRLTVTFRFKRRYGFYLFQAYFPTSLTVASSWICFWLDSKAVSARITLSVSSLLALAYQFGSILGHLPRVSYIKCIDIWMISCMLFIFFTLVQLAVVCLFNQHETQAARMLTVLRKWRNNASSRPTEQLRQLRKLFGGKKADKQNPKFSQLMRNLRLRRNNRTDCIRCTCDEAVGIQVSKVDTYSSLNEDSFKRSSTAPDQVWQYADGDDDEHETAMYEPQIDELVEAIDRRLTNNNVPTELEKLNSTSSGETEAVASRRRSKSMWRKRLAGFCPYVSMKNHIRWLIRYKSKAYTLDSFCKLAFPLTFFLFNSWYWIYYALMD